jgi:hypothetical protein
MNGKFVRMAEEKQLSPMVAMVCLYVLYTPDKGQGRNYLMQLPLFGPTDELVQYHNYVIYHSMSLQKQLLFGEILEFCPMPLYPHVSGISRLNDEVRAVAVQTKFSGGSEPSGDASAFKKSTAQALSTCWRAAVTRRLSPTVRVSRSRQWIGRKQRRRSRTYTLGSKTSQP